MYVPVLVVQHHAEDAAVGIESVSDLDITVSFGLVHGGLGEVKCLGVDHCPDVFTTQHKFHFGNEVQDLQIHFERYEILVCFRVHVFVVFERL